MADDAADAIDTAETDDGAADTGDAGPLACKTTLDGPQGGAACQANVCVGGVCEPRVRSDGTACDDGVPCTATATCQGGDCKAVLAVDCDDGTLCTVDTLVDART
ncbi:MAG: hypothetical protein RIT45_933 [Pseudomonadota bacterium]